MNRWNPILTLLACFISVASFGTHMRGGQISVRMLSPGSLLAEIRLIVYIDTESPVPFGGGNTDILYIRGSSGAGDSPPIPEITKDKVPPGATWTLVDEA